MLSLGSDRINRIYFEKQGSLIADYLGVAHELGKGDLTLDQRVARSGYC